MTRLSDEQATQLLKELSELKLKREATWFHISSPELQKLHQGIEERVVPLIRDTQHDRELHLKVMAELDKQDIELDEFREFLGPLNLEGD